MKNIVLVALILTLSISCKKETKSENTQNETITGNIEEKTTKQNDGLTLLKGEFVYYKDAAVLQTHADIYGVFVNAKMLELDTLAGKYKKEPTDMVPVEIRGKITNKKDNKILWENKVEIVEILKVSEPQSEESNVIKLGH